MTSAVAPQRQLDLGMGLYKGLLSRSRDKASMLSGIFDRDSFRAATGLMFIFLSKVFDTYNLLFCGRAVIPKELPNCIILFD